MVFGQLQEDVEHPIPARQKKQIAEPGLDPQPAEADQLGDGQGDVGPSLHEGDNVSARNEQHLTRIDRLGVLSPRLAVEDGQLTEQFPFFDERQYRLVAVLRV